VKKKIFRKYLEIKSLKDFKEVKKPLENYLVVLVNPKDFQLNKFFYRNIGKKHKWVDRLTWSDKNWIDYVSDKKLYTFVMKDKDELVGYFELIFYQDTRESEIAYLGILENYFGNRLGGYILSEAIKKSFTLGSLRTWVHTSSLDHKNALKNYLARGMKIFKSETLII
jgi:ribosomal protein S18 acetylase RimI-like enzyme